MLNEPHTHRTGGRVRDFGFGFGLATENIYIEFTCTVTMDFGVYLVVVNKMFKKKVQ